MPPPVSYLDITSFPYSQLVAIADFNAGTYGGVVNECWLRRIVTDDEEFLGMFIAAVGGFIPEMNLYEDDGSTLIRNCVNAAWYNRLVPETYYIRVRNSPGFGATADDFTVTANVTPTLAVASGDAVINDDSPVSGSSPLVSWPGTVWSINGTLKGFKHNIPAGEIGDALPTGENLWHDKFGTRGAANTFCLFDADLNAIAEGIVFPSPEGGDPNICNDGTKFYVKSGFKIRTISSLGVISALLDELTFGGSFYTAIGVKRDSTILYHAHGYADGVIGQWDLVNHVDLADFYTIPGFVNNDDFCGLTALNNKPGEIIVLSDDTLVTYWYDLSEDTFHLIHLSSGGVVLHDYSYDGSIAGIDHIHYSSLGNPTYVKMWQFIDGLSGNRGRIGDLELATGTYTYYDTDLYNAGEDLVNNSNQLHKPSASCSIVTILYESTPTPEPVVTGGIYKMVPGKRSDTLYMQVSPSIKVKDVKIP